jgi:predicted HTH domain antitoxin
MEITVQLPDDLMLQQNPARTALEALVIEGYRSGVLSHFQAGSLLGFSRFETDGFFKKHEVEDHAYGVDDLACDLMSISATPSFQQRSS